MNERMWPADSVERVPIATLLPYARNARLHSDEQVEQIARSMDEFGWTVPILLDERREIIAGHGRVLAARLRGFAEAPCMVARGWSEAQIKAYRLADNQLTLLSDWSPELLKVEFGELKTLEFDLSLTGFTAGELERYMGDGITPEQARATLAERFMIAPFSVLNAREGWWQDRKRAWIALGIQSELGRGENLQGFSDTILRPDPAKRLQTESLRGGLTFGTTTDPYRAKEKDAARVFGQDLMRGEHVVGTKTRHKPNAKPAGGGGGAWAEHNRKQGERAALRAIGTQDWVQGKITEGDIEGGMAANQSGTSIFDPVLCEVAYRWFSPPAGVVLDPFAGGSVRGIVASRLGRAYHGVDLSPRQAEANIVQAAAICDGFPGPLWYVGDAIDVVPQLDVEADLVFSCPPYGDLEVYSEDSRDLSTMDRASFLAAFRTVVAVCVAKLKRNRFACVVVGDYRGKDGFYSRFPSETIMAFEAAGAKLYNEAILVTAAGLLPIRAGKQFEATRKLGKTHQNVLVFVKGDARAATEACGAVEFGDIDEQPQPEAPSTDLGAQFGEPL